MKMSCNGCRILRKACCSDCPIRPCLQWIKSPESQSNATLFLAKFYGRAGLVNLIEAGPPHLRPALFRSLLYEACGRIVSPVHGSVGLLWSGNWVHCQAAVDAVLKGSPIVPLPSPVGGPAPHLISPLETCDIRHVGKMPSWADLNRIQNRDRFNWSNLQNGAINNIHGLVNPGKLCFEPIPNHYRGPGQVGNRDSNMEDDSMFSVETVEGSLVNRAEPGPVLQFKGLSDDQDGDREVGLDLTLSLAPM